MLKAMTTIEFCEKSIKRTSYDASSYDRGALGNVYAVLGDNPMFWLLPVSPPTGDGLAFTSFEDTPLRLSKDMDSGRDLRKKKHDEGSPKPKPKGPKGKKHSGAAGTGEAGSDISAQDSESGGEAAADLEKLEDRGIIKDSSRGGSRG